MILDRLPSEIFPIIADHLPLRLTPSTLLALALVNHALYEQVIHLISWRLILKNETDAIKVMQRLLHKPDLGKVVHEIHILSDLSCDTRSRKNPLNIIAVLENLIATTSLPYIHTLGLHLLTGWYHHIQDNQFQRVVGFGRLQSNFGMNLRKNCPRLRGLVLQNIADDYEDPWVNDSGLLEMQDITSLTLIFKRFTLPLAACEKLLKNIERLSANLHKLDIAPHCAESTSASPLLALTFPKLRYLCLGSFALEDSAQAMAFWIRHPELEVLKIFDSDGHTPWFSRDSESIIPQVFLPNLKHLKAPFHDVTNLSPILTQLISLTVYGTINAQIPFLLRAVLPNGLPNLKSLNIGQKPSNSSKNAKIEGARWYESVDGEFCEAKARKAGRTVLNGYIPSIARGAPNLEEIGFHSHGIRLEEFAKIASEIQSFSKLRRFYFEGLAESTDVGTMLSSARILGEACRGLSMLVDTSSINLPYPVARIRRTESGEVSSVDIGTGFGMQIGNEDEAFPD